MSVVYIALGSNMGDRQKNIAQALALLQGARVKILRKSSLYETKPYGVTDQPDFLNGAIKVEWAGTPQTLLTTLLKVEQTMGRQRIRHWGERNIDLDILFFGDVVLNTPELILPHPDLQNRLFVLEPLCEIAGRLVHPVLGKTMDVLLQELRDKK